MYISKNQIKKDLYEYVELIEQSINEENYSASHYLSVELIGIILWTSKKGLLDSHKASTWIDTALNYFLITLEKIRTS